MTTALIVIGLIVFTVWVFYLVKKDHEELERRDREWKEMQAWIKASKEAREQRQAQVAFDKMQEERHNDKRVIKEPRRSSAGKVGDGWDYSGTKYRF